MAPFFIIVSDTHNGSNHVHDLSVGHLGVLNPLLCHFLLKIVLSVQVKSRLVDLSQAVLASEDEHELLGDLVFLAIRQHLTLTVLMEHD